MKIGLIDVDGMGYPNLPLMKWSAWHKQQGDAVEWYSPLFSGHCDVVYMSKVFTFTPDYEYYIDADKIVRGARATRSRKTKTASKHTTKNLTHYCPTMSNTFTPTILYTPKRQTTRHTALCHAGARETAHFATSRRKKRRRRIKLPTCRNFGGVKRN